MSAEALETETSRRSRRRSPADWARAEIALAAVLLFCPLAIATVHLWAIGVAAGLALLACCLAVLAAFRSGERLLIPEPGIALLVVTGFIGLQLVPLPPSLVGLLAPQTREVFEVALGPLREYPAWRPLSLDPPATARELVKALTCVAVLFAAAQLARSRRARSRIVTVLGVAGLLVALIGFGHALWGARALFGVFSYTWAHPPFLSTFGNPNHLASFLALGATALLARVLAERDRKVATLWAIAYAATGVGVLLTLSRGGIVAFVAAQLMLGLAVHAARAREREGRPVEPRSLVVPGAVLAVLAISAYLAWDALALELATADSLEKVRDSKISFWPSFLPLVRGNWLVGVGRGAFEPAFQRFQDLAMGSRLTHPENLVFQQVCELGVPMGLFFVGACAWALLGAMRRAGADPERLACAFGLAAIGLHELVDFGLELEGLAVPATAALAVATARSEGGRRVRRKVVLGFLPIGAAVGLVALLAARSSLESDGAALAEKAAKLDADVVAAEASRLAARHPADYYLHLLAAQAYAAETPMRPERVVAWASRAMFLNAAQPAPHRLAGRALKAIGHPAQARLEYRIAWQLGDRSVLKESSRVFSQAERLLELVPDEPKALDALADELLGQQRLEEAEAVARASLERHGESVGALLRLSRVGLARRDADEVFRLGERMTAVAPKDALGLTTRVNALVMRSEIDAAVGLLSGEGLSSFPFDPEIPMALARLELSRGNTRGCRDALGKLPTGIDVSTRVRALGMESAAAERDGQIAQSLSLMRTALALRPEDSGLRWRYATLLERVGRLDQALGEAQQALARSPGLQVEADRMRKRIEERKLQLEQTRRWRELGEEPPRRPSP